ncbi:MAG: N-acetyltransferase family protein [Hyphomicrobiaceae bacterium]
MADTSDSGGHGDAQNADGAVALQRRADVAARVTFRRFEPRDIEAVRRLLWRVWSDAYTPILGAEGVERHCTQLHTKARLAAIARDTDVNCSLVADLDGDIIAFASALLHWTGAVDIYEVYVDMPYQGLGLGTRLLEAAFYRFPGAHRWRIEVLADNTAAIALYERLGFRRTGSRPDWFQPEITVLQLARPNTSGARYGVAAMLTIQLRSLAQALVAVR